MDFNSPRQFSNPLTLREGLGFNISVFAMKLELKISRQFYTLRLEVFII